MGMTGKRRREWLLAAVALVLVVLAGRDLARIATIESWNRAIADGSVSALKGELPLPMVFAQAYHRNEDGDYQPALALYKRVERGGDPVLRVASLFNSGNAYFREGLEQRRASNEQQAMPLLELAKQSYRQVLKVDPRHWDARYNLERVLRESPEPDDTDAGGLDAPQQAERAVTTMRGFTLGLP